MAEVRPGGSYYLDVLPLDGQTYYYQAAAYDPTSGLSPSTWTAWTSGCLAYPIPADRRRVLLNAVSVYPLLAGPLASTAASSTVPYTTYAGPYIFFSASSGGTVATSGATDVFGKLLVEKFNKVSSSAPDTLDGVPDGGTYARPLTTILSSGILKRQAPLDDGNYNLAAASSQGMTASSNVTDVFGKLLVEKFNKAGTSVSDDLDGVPDGSSYGRLKVVHLSSGILKRQAPLDDGLYNLAAASSAGLTASTGAQDGFGQLLVLKFNKGASSAPDNLDGIGDGTSYARPKAGILSSGILKRGAALDDGLYALAAASSAGLTASTGMADGFGRPVVKLFAKAGTSAADTLDGVPDGMLLVRTPLLAAGQQNLVDNPSFELSTDLAPVGWANGPAFINPANLSWDTSGAYNGARSLVVSSTVQYSGVVMIRRLPVLVSEQYQVSAAIRCSSQAGAAQLIIYDAAGAGFAYATADSVAADGAWHVVTSTAVLVPSSAAGAAIACYVSGAAGGVCEFDQLYALRVPSRGQALDDGLFPAAAASSGGMTLSSGVMDSAAQFVSLKFNKAGTSAPDTLDGVPDGASYARPKTAVLSSGLLRRDTPLADGLYSVAAASSAGLTMHGSVADAGGRLATYLLSKGASSAPDSLDGVPDGTTYARAKAAILSSGILKRAAALDDGLYNLAAASSAGLTASTALADGFGRPVVSLLAKASTAAPDNLDGVSDGTTYARVKSGVLSSGLYKRAGAFDDGAYALSAGDTLGKQPTSQLWLPTTQALLVGTSASPSSISKTLRFSWNSFTVVSTGPWAAAGVGDYVYGTSAPFNGVNALGLRASLVLPIGATVTAVAVSGRGASSTTADSVSAGINKLPSTAPDASPTSLASVAAAGASWQYVSASLSEVIGSTSFYYIPVALNPTSSGTAGWPGFAYVDVTYAVPRYDVGY